MADQNNLPFADSYWVLPGKFIAGEYPVAHGIENSQKRIQALLRSGVRTFIDLTQPGDSLHPYTALLHREADEYGFDIAWRNYPIPDLGIPAKSQMKEILNEIDLAITHEKMPYVHCMAGIGRTGTVVGCYLVRHGCPVKSVIGQIAILRREVPTWWCASPEMEEQVQFILDWQVGE